MNEQGLYQGKPLVGSGGVLTPLLKDLTQIALQAEMEAHLKKLALKKETTVEMVLVLRMLKLLRELSKLMYQEIGMLLLNHN